MSANLMYSPLETAFEATMQREGRTLTTYMEKQQFLAFFRIRNDHENQRETIVIYYDITAPVRPGTLVIIGDDIFIALNRESVENDIYYKSAMVKCNGTYNDNQGKIYNIPFYSDNMKASLSIGNSFANLLNGNIEILTEDNSKSKEISIDDTFNTFDRTFKVTNKYAIDGIMHIIAEVRSDQDAKYTYRIEVSGLSDSHVRPGDEIQLSAVLYVNDNAHDGTTFEWSSSDNSVAAVNNAGKVVCLSEGDAVITAAWVEKNITQSVDIIVSEEEKPVTPNLIFSIGGISTIRTGMSKTYTLYIKDLDGNEVKNVAFEWNVIADFDVGQDITGDGIRLSVTDDEDLIEKQIILQVISDQKVKAEKEIEVIGFF